VKINPKIWMCKTWHNFVLLPNLADGWSYRGRTYLMSLLQFAFLQMKVMLILKSSKWLMKYFVIKQVF